jgi:signal peptidase I
MKNTLLIGDHLFVKKFAYGVPVPHIPWLEVPVWFDTDGDGHIIKGEGPKRGDIVIFRYPRNEKIHYVKRCVGEPGDILFVHKKSLYLHPHEGNDYARKTFAGCQMADINGRLFVKDPFRKMFPGIHNDPLVTDDGMQPIEIFEFGPVQVPQDGWFMMGDNRDHSNDSRFWGPVPYRLVVGKPWFIYFSWDRNYTIRWDRVGRDVETLEREQPRYVE